MGLPDIRYRVLDGVLLRLQDVRQRDAQLARLLGSDELVSEGIQLGRRGAVLRSPYRRRGGVDQCVKGLGELRVGYLGIDRGAEVRELRQECVRGSGLFRRGRRDRRGPDQGVGNRMLRKRTAWLTRTCPMGLEGWTFAVVSPPRLPRPPTRSPPRPTGVDQTSQSLRAPLRRVSAGSSNPTSVE